MASLYERPDSPYLWVAFRDLDGRQRKKNTKLRKDSPDDRQKAERLCRELEQQTARAREITTSATITVREWFGQWIEAREKKIKSIADDRSRIKTHVLPRIGSLQLRAVRKADLQKVFDELRDEHLAGKLASGTIKSIHSAVKVMFADAVAADLIPSSPLFLTSKTLPTVHKERTRPYTLAEIETLLTCPEVPDDRRALYCLLFFLGGRFGEGAALRWRHYDTETAPLARVRVEESWSNRRKRFDTTKTEVKTDIPLHPAARCFLEHWRTVGFPALFGREPQPEDLIVPSREGRPRSSNHGLKKLRLDLKRAGIGELDSRKQHAFRTTFITTLRSAKVEKDKVRSMTHARRESSDAIDAFYTIWPWEVLCGAVMQIPLTEGFLRFCYGLVSVRNDEEKWRGGRDLNPDFLRNWGKAREDVGRLLQSSAKPEAGTVTNLSTVQAAGGAGFVTVFPEPFTAEEIARVIALANAATARAHSPRVTAFVEGWATAKCPSCSREVELYDQGGALACPVCAKPLPREGVIYAVE